jgi:hypothetical protein
VGLGVKKEIDEEYEYSSDPKYTSRVNKVFSDLANKSFQAPVSAYEAYLTTKLIHALYVSNERRKWVYWRFK